MPVICYSQLSPRAREGRPEIRMTLQALERNIALNKQLKSRVFVKEQSLNVRSIIIHCSADA